MAIKSLRKKSNKRLSSSDTINSSNNSMAPSARKFHLTHKRATLLISAVLLVCVVTTLSVSLKMRSVSHSNSLADRIYSGQVVNEFPHDPNAFTQGLLYAGNDTLFESTGLYGHSSVRRVALGTGKVEAIQNMERSQFGEGLTLLGDRLFQVTWLKKTGFIYDRNNLRNVRVFTNPMQDGWGLATDGKILFGSDGSSTLYKIDPRTLRVVERHIIRYKGHEVHNLNELEYVNGEVWANVWQVWKNAPSLLFDHATLPFLTTDCIARISGKDGALRGWIYVPHLRERLVASGNTGIDVLNGIAWDQEQNRIFLTGKLWPKLYEIMLQPVTRFNGNIENLCLRAPAQF